MTKLSDLYKPLTAHPFRCSASYWEAEPCAALKPYIRCFWGTVHPVEAETEVVDDLVTPDTCCDVIFTVNHTENCVYDLFCGINDSAFGGQSYTQQPHICSTFGIRFYAWSAVVFSEDTMAGSKNEALGADCRFSALRKALAPHLFDAATLSERIQIAEDFLLRHMHPERSSAVVQNSLYEILSHKGNLRTETLSRTLHVSTRQLERRFAEETGISPKQLTTLIRYQYFWEGLLQHRFRSLADAALELGYTDQAHLARNFKRFHTLTIRESLQHAAKDVAFLQDKRDFFL